MGRFWQEQGLLVIPTVRWSTPESYEFCFTGIPRDQVVATGTPDLRDAITCRLFARGLAKMFKRLEPRCLILFGRPPKDFPIKKSIPRSCRLIVHPSHWQALRARAGPKRGQKTSEEQYKRRCV